MYKLLINLYPSINIGGQNCDAMLIGAEISPLIVYYLLFFMADGIKHDDEA
ncbi:hypothetical protein XBJ2_1830006 [Xenorhabdus bovienii str. Jollieti]|nr:hypothetical protein XBJ2_1830006 [Xenorhabdus bovienii str. Jollieti]